jgi:hypothetical protein
MPLRWNSSALGTRRVPQNMASASGLWSLRDAAIYERSKQWKSIDFSQFPQLSLWLDAADSSTLFDAVSGGSAVAADGAVSRWEDKSGNRFHVTQSTANNRPLRRTAQFNGRDALDFDGSDDRLLGASLDGAVASRHSYSAFAVANADTVGTNSANSFENEAIWGDLNGNAALFLRSNNTVGAYNFDGTDDKATESYTAGALAVFYSELSGGNIRIRVNGGNETAVASGVNSGLTTINIGRQFNNNNYCFDGRICEIIFFRQALGSPQRQAIEGYLAHKWGLTGDLPATHPYKNVVP